jgi:transposase
MNPSKPRRLYTPGFKAQAIELLAIGRPVTELAAELCISANLHYSWRNSSQAVQVVRCGVLAYGLPAIATDLRSLRREVTLLRQENDILKRLFSKICG